jgi:stearoyl-CoA desaturase (delta-9 desaturase)
VINLVGKLLEIIMEGKRRFRLNNLDWVNTLFLVLTPLATIALVVVYVKKDGFDPLMLIPAVMMYFISGLSITAGYHRLFSHKAYQANSFLKFIYLLFGAGAFQNSALKWCTDHRRHHAHCDDEKDPYNIREGFWWAHMGWVMVKEEEKYNGIYAKDLASDKLVWLQHKYYLPLCVLSGFIIPTIIGYFMGSALGGLAVVGVGRVVFVHHCTFFINSWAHMWGTQPYTDTNTAKDNFLLAVFSYGEGYHNFHHFFQNDYRNGVRWYQYDPTKWLILLSEKAGWAHSLKRTSEEEILKAKLEMTEKRLATKGADLSALDQVKQKIDEAILNLQELRRELKRASDTSELELLIKEELKALRAAFDAWSYSATRLNFA